MPVEIDVRRGKGWRRVLRTTRVRPAPPAAVVLRPPRGYRERNLLTRPTASAASVPAHPIRCGLTVVVPVECTLVYLGVGLVGPISEHPDIWSFYWGTHFEDRPDYVSSINHALQDMVGDEFARRAPRTSGVPCRSTASGRVASSATASFATTRRTAWARGTSSRPKSSCCSSARIRRAQHLVAMERPRPDPGHLRRGGSGRQRWLDRLPLLHAHRGPLPAPGRPLEHSVVHRQGAEPGKAPGRARHQGVPRGRRQGQPTGVPRVRGGRHRPLSLHRLGRPAEVPALGGVGDRRHLPPGRHQALGRPHAGAAAGTGAAALLVQRRRRLRAGVAAPGADHLPGPGHDRGVEVGRDIRRPNLRPLYGQAGPVGPGVSRKDHLEVGQGRPIRAQQLRHQGLEPQPGRPPHHRRGGGRSVRRARHRADHGQG